MVGLIHPHGDHQPGGGGEGGDGPHCCPDTEGVGDHAGEQDADSEACVTNSNTIGGICLGRLGRTRSRPVWRWRAARRVAVSFSLAAEGRLVPRSGQQCRQRLDDHVGGDAEDQVREPPALSGCG